MRTPTPEEITAAATRLGKSLGLDTNAELEELVTTAWQLIGAWLGPESVPNTVMSQAVHTTALELQRREKAPGGVLAPFGGEGGPVRLARDPLTPALPILRPFVGGGIG